MGKAVFGGGPAGIAVAEALGLNANQVSEIHLHYDCNSVVTADVRMFVHDDQHDRLVSILKQYEMFERDDVSQEDVA
jgi:hypothetical protein